MSERRWKVLWIDQDALWGALAPLGQTGVRYQPYFVGVPEGARLVDVCYDWQRRSFGLRLEHPSFEPVLDGQEAPWFGPGAVEFRQVDMPQVKWSSTETDPSKILRPDGLPLEVLLKPGPWQPVPVVGGQSLKTTNCQFGQEEGGLVVNFKRDGAFDAGNWRTEYERVVKWDKEQTRHLREKLAAPVPTPVKEDDKGRLTLKSGEPVKVSASGDLHGDRVTEITNACKYPIRVMGFDGQWHMLAPGESLRKETNSQEKEEAPTPEKRGYEFL